MKSDCLLVPVQAAMAATSHTDATRASVSVDDDRVNNVKVLLQMLPFGGVTPLLLVLTVFLMM